MLKGLLRREGSADGLVRRSLQKRVSYTVISVFLLVLPLATVALFASSVYSAGQAVKIENRRLAGFISAALSQALWEVDLPRVQSIGESIASDWNVAAVRVVDDGGKELFAFGPEKAPAFSIASSTKLRLERKGQLLGTVVFLLDSRPYYNEAFEASAFAFVVGLLLLSLVLLAMRRAILHELREPLDDIALLVSSFGTEAEHPQKRDFLRYVEFDALRDLLILMGETIKKQIGELESSLKERDVLMREINHRVKNNLQLLASIIDQQAETSGQERLVLKKLLGRIESIAVAYDQLWVSKRLNGIRMDEYLNEISQLIATTPRFAGIKIESDLDALYFSLDYAMHCGLIFYELTANAAEHAYGGKGGTVRVSLKRTAGDIILSVADNGAGCASDFRTPPSSGLGFRFVGALADQLQARVEQDHSNGCCFLIRFSAAGLDAAFAREFESA